MVCKWLLKKYVTLKIAFFGPSSPMSQFVIFLSNPLPLCYSLETDKLWHETDEYIFYIWLHKDITLY